MAYTTSTQLYNWRFTPDELAVQRQECNAEARRRLAEKFKAKAETSGDAPVEPVFLTAEDEFTLVKRYIFALKQFFAQFDDIHVPPEVFAFAATYLKRFYLKNSVLDFYPRDMMLTAFYMACKVADYPLGLDVFCAKIPRNTELYHDFIQHSELFLMDKLQYDIWVHTPYRPLNGLLVELLAYRHESNRELMSALRKEGHEIIQLWFQTDLCLTHTPSQFAMAVLLELGNQHPELGVEEFLRQKVVVAKDESEEQKVAELWEKIEAIQSMIREFEFVEDLAASGDLEETLTLCRNPLYDPKSEEYAAAKAEVEKKASFSE